MLAAAGSLAAAGALPGCGRKGAVKPPQLVVPAPIEDLAAGNQVEGVALTWSRPTDYADGTRMNDLGGFTVQRAAGGTTSFSTIATLPVTDRERFRQVKRFRTADAAVDAGVTYRYRVVSFTVDGYASAPSNIASVTRQVPAPTPGAAEGGATGNEPPRPTP